MARRKCAAAMSAPQLVGDRTSMWLYISPVCAEEVLMLSVKNADVCFQTETR